jgi:phosphatidylinositol dimannoside acyltransferase
MPAGAAKLAIQTGAALLPVHSHYDRDDMVITMAPPLDTTSGDVATITQALADRFARNIAAHPADWHMMQPQWLADLSQERRAKLAGDPSAGGTT